MTETENPDDWFFTGGPDRWSF